MVLTFYNLNSHTGLQQLDEYLLTRSYISGYLPSKDDITVYATISPRHSSDFINVSRWYNHIDALLRLSGVTAKGKGVIIESSPSSREEAPGSPPVACAKASCGF